MLYKKNSSKELDMALFKNPTSEYRGTPFWSWNCKLNTDLLGRQIDYLKEMGFGGFHMHSRSGMATDYLSEDFMKLVKFCSEKAKKEDMLAWLYDEDRWPSGFGGGFVTKNIKYRRRYLLFTEEKQEKSGSLDDYINKGIPHLVACFDIQLDKNGKLASYNMIAENDTAVGRKRFAYAMTDEPTGWFNNQTYLDTMNSEGIDEFIRITHEAYKREVGDEFGKSIPAIFSDEPQTALMKMLSYSDSDDVANIAWTYDFPETFKKQYNKDLIPYLPEIFYDLPDGKVSHYRYLYHDHATERFVSAYCDRCGEWCEKNDIAFTGHVMCEDTLGSQTSGIGEALRCYRKFGIPGIDILCDGVNVETGTGITLNTAKQAQSAVHQFGREAMMSELYGVTGWGFDFRGHKFQGDWQAALGVTVRVPHLSWVSMKGSAKRDYPASINYQSPWYNKYSYVENHFARLNTVLTRGKPVANIGVIHPIESYWINYGPADTGSDVKETLENNFVRLTEYLVGNFTDFDFISESLLPSQCGEISEKLTVGEMKYSVIIVPACITLRKTTLEILKKFHSAGGRLIFIGDCPKYIDAIPSNEILELYNDSTVIPFDENAIYNTLKDDALLTVYTMKTTLGMGDDSGRRMKNFVSNCRIDGDTKWLFIAHWQKTTKLDDANHESLKFVLNGEFDVELYDTVNAVTEKIPCTVSGGKTTFFRDIYAHDSLLLKLTAFSGKAVSAKAAEKEVLKTIDFKDILNYKRAEDNVYILDMAKYSLDGGEINDTEEMLRIDMACRKILGYPSASGTDAQPWVLGEEKIEHYVTLYFDIDCEADFSNTYLATEEITSAKLNGQILDLTPSGYFVDESIIKYALPLLKKGINTLEITVPIGKRTSIENAFITGDFDVYVQGCTKKIKAVSDKIGFGDITSQGMPFYGGNLTYTAEIDTPDCELNIRASRFRGSLVSVNIDGKEAGIIAYAPYTLKIKDIPAGKHTVEFVHYGNRINTFGGLHYCGYFYWIGPEHWYSKDYEFCYEYNLKPTGILSSPVIDIVRKD